MKLSALVLTMWKVNTQNNLVGRGQYGHVVIDLYPLDPEGPGYEFVNEIKGGVNPLVNTFLQLIKVSKNSLNLVH